MLIECFGIRHQQNTLLQRHTGLRLEKSPVAIECFHQNTFAFGDGPCTDLKELAVTPLVVGIAFGFSVIHLHSDPALDTGDKGIISTQWISFQLFLTLPTRNEKLHCRVISIERILCYEGMLGATGVAGGKGVVVARRAHIKHLFLATGAE